MCSNVAQENCAVLSLCINQTTAGQSLGLSPRGLESHMISSLICMKLIKDWLHVATHLLEPDCASDPAARWTQSLTHSLTSLSSLPLLPPHTGSLCVANWFWKKCVCVCACVLWINFHSLPLALLPPTIIYNIFSPSLLLSSPPPPSMSKRRPAHLLARQSLPPAISGATMSTCASLSPSGGEPRRASPHTAPRCVH